MDPKTHKRLAILDILRSAGQPLTSTHIAEELESRGHHIKERTVRLYVQKMDEEGLTQSLGKRGRTITDRGIREVESSRILDRVGFLSAKIDQMMFDMDFDLATRTGSVVVNMTVVKPEHLVQCMDSISLVFKKGYAMGSLLTLFSPGDGCAGMIVPKGHIGIGTVCSITVNGVLLKGGIPTHSRFGGLMELQGGKPSRFVEIIMYDGTSIDPLEVFIRGGMTNYLGAVRTGNGRIGASFREFPAGSRERVIEIARKMDEIGLGGLMDLGTSGRPLFEIPVSPGVIGSVVVGGLNPMAIFEESGIRVQSRALAGLVDFDRLFRYEELASRLANMLGHPHA
jgi:repressor of nif and glnA expression